MRWFTGIVLVLLATTVLQAAHIDTVFVGNAGNGHDIHGDGYGSVDYSYSVGQYEVTAGQYTDFLNAAATTDSHGLYNSNMWSNVYGCKIDRSGTSGSYTYSVADEWANRPVNYVGWGDAARFCNWLHNGQPTGVQSPTATEDGAYRLNGATSVDDLVNVTRTRNWKWAIPTEHEWYKAAYHKNDGVTDNYFDYPTSNSVAPGYVNNDGDLSTTGASFTDGIVDPGNYATHDGDGGTFGIGNPYYRTEVGEWENSDGPYGTFDQGGNVEEWTEAILYTTYRGCRGGSFTDRHDDFMDASDRNNYLPTNEGSIIGFRVVRNNVVPAPSSLTCMGELFGLALIASWWRRVRASV